MTDVISDLSRSYEDRRACYFEFTKRIHKGEGILGNQRNEAAFLAKRFPDLVTDPGSLSRLYGDNVKCEVSPGSLWFRVPPVIPRRLEFGRYLFYEGSLLNEFKKIEENPAYKRFRESIQSGFAVVFKYDQGYPFHKDIDNLEGKALLNLVVKNCLGLDDSPEFLKSIYETSEFDSEIVTKIGVLTLQEYSKFLQNEAQKCS